MTAIQNARPKLVRVLSGVLPDGITASIVEAVTPTKEKTGELRVSGNPTVSIQGTVVVVLQVEAYNGTTADYTLTITVEDDILQIYLVPKSGTMTLEQGTPVSQKLSEVSTIPPTAVLTINPTSFTRSIAYYDPLNLAVTAFTDGPITSHQVVSGELPPGVEVTYDPGASGSVRLTGELAANDADPFTIRLVSANGTANLALDLTVDNTVFTVTQGQRMLPLFSDEVRGESLIQISGAESLQVLSSTGLASGISATVNGNEIRIQTSGTGIPSRANCLHGVVTVGVTFASGVMRTIGFAFDYTYRLGTNNISLTKFNPLVLGQGHDNYLSGAFTIVPEEGQDTNPSTVTMTHGAPGVTFEITETSPGSIFWKVTPSTAPGLYPYTITAEHDGMVESFNSCFLVVDKAAPLEGSIETNVIVGQAFFQPNTDWSSLAGQGLAAGFSIIDAQRSTGAIPSNVALEIKAVPLIGDSVFVTTSDGGLPAFTGSEGYYWRVLNGGIERLVSMTTIVEAGGLAQFSPKVANVVHNLESGVEAAVRIAGFTLVGSHPQNPFVYEGGLPNVTAQPVPGMVFEIRPSYENMQAELWVTGTPTQTGTFEVNVGIMSVLTGTVSPTQQVFNFNVS